MRRKHEAEFFIDSEEIPELQTKAKVKTYDKIEARDRNKIFMW